MKAVTQTIAAAAVALAPVVRAQTGPGAPFTTEAVAAAHPLASEAGAEILAAGGNAVDAAVATSFALAVVRPESCGIGGGGFMIIHAPSGGEGGEGAPVQVALDYREAAPAAVGADFYERRPDGASTRGATAAGVPGTVAGLLMALERYGTMERAEVMAPAIRLARDGFEADAHLVGAARGLIPDFLESDWPDRFGFVWERYLQRGELQPGDLIRNPEMARCLEMIAERGAAAFYDGPIAEAIVRAVERDGGPMMRADLQAYQPREAPPLRYRFAGFEFLGMPPPSSGGVAMAETLGVLERTGFLDGEPGWTVDRAHLFAEALKHAFADRAEWLGDWAMVDVPVDRLLSDAYLDELAARVRPGATLAPESYGSRADPARRAGPPPDDGGTSHFCIIDQWGGAVACTETVNLSFGSLLAVPEFGFVLNNEMDDFTTRRGEPNAFGLRQSDRNLPAPGKRPLSSMSPTIALEGGEVAAVAGAAGGPRIISAALQALLNGLVFDMTASEALSSPRLHHQWAPATLWLQPGWWEGDRAGAAASLESRGHDVARRADLGEAQLILRRGNAWDAACDASTGSRPAGR